MNRVSTTGFVSSAASRYEISQKPNTSARPVGTCTGATKAVDERLTFVII